MKKLGFIFMLVFSSILIISGIVGIIFAEDYFYGVWTEYKVYGGDAYTGIQNAAADTSQNVYYLGRELSEFRFALFTVLSIVLIGLGGFMMGFTFLSYGYTKKKETSAAPAAVSVPTLQQRCMYCGEPLVEGSPFCTRCSMPIPR